MAAGEAADEAFSLFLLTKRANGVKTKTIALRVALTPGGTGINMIAKQGGGQAPPPSECW